MSNGSTIIGNDHNRIAIEISTRKMFRHLRMNSDRIRSPKLLTITRKQSLSFTVLVIHHQFWNLESSSMRKSNQSYSISVFIFCSENLVRLHRRNRQNDLSCLFRQICGLQMYS